MSASLALEKPLRIAYMGPEATFSHLASLKKFGSCVGHVACDNVAAWNVNTRDVNNSRSFDEDRLIIDVFAGVGNDSCIRAIEAAPAIAAASAPAPASTMTLPPVPPVAVWLVPPVADPPVAAALPPEPPPPVSGARVPPPPVPVSEAARPSLLPASGCDDKGRVRFTQPTKAKTAASAGTTGKYDRPTWTSPSIIGRIME